MTTGATGQLGLALPVQGELSGTWGDTVNNGITQYTNIAIAGTLTLTNDGAVTLANTTGDASASNITSSLTGAGTVTAQFAIVKVTGTLTTAKVVTGPSYSKTYTVVNAATGGIVTFKASGQTGVSIAVGETAFVYFNGTDYVKVAGTVAVSSFQTSLGGLTPSTATTGVVTLAGTLNTTSGGTGLASYTAGDLSYYASGTAFTKLAIGTAGQILTSSGSAPQWSTLSGVAVTTFSAGTTGFTPNTATSGAITLAGTLATTNGGTGLTSFTANGVVYASSTSALATGSALTFDGSNVGVTASSSAGFVGITTQNTSAGAGASSGVGINNDSTASTYLRTYGSGQTNTLLGSVIANYTALLSDGVASNGILFGTLTNKPIIFGQNNAEQMRLTSTGLGIGTSSPAGLLDVSGTTPALTASQSSITVTAGTLMGAFNAYSRDSSTTSTGGVGGIRVYASADYNTSNTPSYMSFFTHDTTPNDGTLLGNPTERMRLDKDGNLGLGVTPSAWRSNTPAFQIGSAGVCLFSDTGITADVGNNAFLNSSSQYIYLRTDAASRYRQYQGVHSWLTAASGTAGNAISFSTVMTLTAAGALGLGTTSPNKTGYNSDATVQTIYGLRRGILELGSDSPFNSDTLGAIDFLSSTSNKGYIRCVLDGSANGLLTFGTNSAERMRISSGGIVSIGYAGNWNDTAAYLHVLSGIVIGSSASPALFTSIKTSNGYDLTLTANANPANIGVNANIIFSSGNSGGGGPSELGRFTSAGNFGINTSSPGQRLDVNGNIRARDGAFILSVGTAQQGIFCTYNQIFGSGSDYTPTIFSETGLGIRFPSMVLQPR